MSPRLLWCEQHRVSTKRLKHGWEAVSPHSLSIGMGATEEEAQADWGVKSNTRLWNEVM